MKKLLFLLLFLPSVLFAQENRSFTETKRGVTTQQNQFKIKEHNKNLLIGTSPNEKKYKLQAETLWTRWNIPITKAYIDKNGEATLIYKHPISGATHQTTIRKENVNKIRVGSKNNKKEINVENLAGRKFYLVKIK
ncbi:MAG: hypothetical protein P8H17_04525 [Flavobacteriales bacterium]|nr:hypothetical protein [Flavobacteriales bacterium]